MKKIKVLIIDDSALVRRILSIGLSRDPQIEVVATASDPYMARDLIVIHNPHVITLDVEMPRMDGVTFLKTFMPIKPIPTIIISSLTQSGKQITLEALQAGAVDIITKPKVGLTDEFPRMMNDIVKRVKAAAQVDAKKLYLQRKKTMIKPTIISHAMDETTDKVIAIGASTGGVEAISRIIPTFPSNSPGVIICQHMPAGFTASFAERLNDSTPLQVREAGQGDRIRPGLVLIAPGGEKHITVTRNGGEYRINLFEGEKISFNRPSIDVLFNSIAQEVGKNAAVALLTGMGKDGAQGLLSIRNAGGLTLAQDENSCVVFGMPGEAVEIGAAERILPLDQIATNLLGHRQ